MEAESIDNLTKAVSLVMQSRRRTKGSKGPAGEGAPEDIGELFLADLRVWRAKLQEWVEVLSREAGANAPGQSEPLHTCRQRRTAHGGSPQHRPAARRPAALQST